MSNTLYAVRLVAGTVIEGRRLLPGAVLEADAAAAADMIYCGAALLQHDADLPRLAAELRSLRAAAAAAAESR